MSIQPNVTPRRTPLYKVVTRHNGLVFNALACASLLELTAPLHVSVLSALPVFDAPGRAWLEHEWSPGKAARGQRLRAYVEATWDEFDWARANAAFYEAYRPRAMRGYSVRKPAAVALSLCASAAQSAAFYRGLAVAADDPELRELLRGAAEAEAGNFDWFRAHFERLDRARPMTSFESYRIVIRAAADARDGPVRLAFERVAENWCGRAPVPEMSYALFLSRAASLLERTLAPGLLERALFRPWFTAPAEPVALVQRPAHGREPKSAAQLEAA